MAAHSARPNKLTQPKTLGILVAGLLLITFTLWYALGERHYGPWEMHGLPELSPAGELLALSDAMRGNDALRQRVTALAQRDEGWLFIHYREADSEIAAILLLWAGADMGSAAKTREGLDSRIDTFLRRVYGFGADDFIVGHPLMGENPWVRWFNHYKPRLLIQMAARRVYAGDVTYDPAQDRMVIEPRLSRVFLNDFQAFLKEQSDPAPFINNYLAFVESTVGIQNLPQKERKTVDDLMALRQKP